MYTDGVLCTVFYVCSLKSTIPDTLGPERSVLTIEVSSYQGLKMYYGKLSQSVMNHLAPVAYVHMHCIRRVSAIQGSG